MIFSQVNALTNKILEEFDHGRRYDRNNDPLILVSLVSSANVISIDSASYFLCENDFIHNENLPQSLLSVALKVTSEIIGKIPFKDENINRGRNHYGIGTNLQNGFFLIIAVICIFDDARDITETLSRRISSSVK